MNKPRRILLALAVLILAAMLLYPPWRISGYIWGDSPGGYAPIWAAPKGASGIDLSRLAVPCAVVVVLTALLYFLFTPKK